MTGNLNGQLARSSRAGHGGNERGGGDDLDLILLFVYLAGCAGSGKSTLARRLIDRFTPMSAELRLAPLVRVDSDFYHSRKTIQAMSEGTPLNDRQRELWLSKVRAGSRTLAHTGHGGVIACSLLKPEFRAKMLRTFPCADRAQSPPSTLTAKSWVIWLDVHPEELKRRVTERYRAGKHWFPPELVESQIQAATQIRGTRRYIGPVPGEEQNVTVLRTTSNPEADAERAADDLINGLKLRESAVGGFL